MADSNSGSAKKGWIRSKISYVLTTISLGQHPNGIYLNKKRFTTTSFGGVVTILSVLLLLFLGYGLVDDI